MGYAQDTLTDAGTYRRLLFLLSAFPLGHIWFVALVTIWSLALGLLITPFGIPLLILMGLMTRGFATVEASIARGLLDVDAHAPALPPPGGLWQRFRGLFGADFWRAQAYLLIRWLPGFPVAVALFGLLAGALGLIFAPTWLPFVHGGAHLGFWRPHTFLQSLALVPAGLVLLPLTLLLVPPLANPFRSIAAALLSAQTLGVTSGTSRGNGVRIHATVAAMIVSVLTVIWAITSRGYFWPVWVLLPLALALGNHAWFVLLNDNPALVRRFHGSRALAGTIGIGVGIALYFTAVWTITSRGYFWPVWPIIAIAVVIAIQFAAIRLSSPGQTELAERIETLETSRAGAVDVQESELRRIERDLHDGAQARLVALGMNLGMAEQTLADDPERAGALLAEARAGAEAALRELRDLARGIHPPILADRGLEAAIAALVHETPMSVTLAADVPERPPSAVETAAYFVVAEALANAAKHAQASCVDVRIARTGGLLVLDVVDDGVGGADPAGGGLSGLRRRVEALDGTLRVTSPPDGPTAVHAELPCE